MGRTREEANSKSFSAFLWKLIAQGGDDPSKKCRMGIVVDGRERSSSKLGRSAAAAAPSMQNYFGEVKGMSLSRVADVLHACLETVANENHFLGLIDWVELHRPSKAIVKVDCKLGDNDEAAVVVSSGQRFPVAKMDFGWGPPAFGSYHFPWGGQTGYVMPMPSTSKEGDWVVYKHLLKKHLDLVESHASPYLKALELCQFELDGLMIYGWHDL